jgi:hypothetical protein
MLNARQYEYIEYLLANPLATNLEAAEAIGVNRNTISEWKKREDFQTEYRRRLDEKWRDSELMAMETMQNLARSGDFKASKYILDSLGHAAPTKIEADVSAKTDIVINVE